MHLHYLFDGWLGDDLLARHPVFICTDRLENRVFLSASDMMLNVGR